MNSKYISVMLVVAISSAMALPSYARGGFGGGGGHSFGGFGGGGRSFGSGSFGGGDRSFGGGSFGGGDRSFGGGSFGGGDRSFGSGSFGGGDRSFGGGSFSGDRSGNWGSIDKGGNGVWNRPSTGGGWGNHGDMPISTRPTMPDHLPTDGGFGGISGIQNRTPHSINQNNLNDQGSKIRNSFNNDTFNHNNYNNVNVNRGYGYGGYGGYHGYHPYDNGYAHGWAASNAYHGGYWGYPGGWYNPGWSEATMWTCMGISSLTTFLGLGMMGAEMASSKNNNNSSNTNTIVYPVSNVTYEGDTVYVNGSPSGTPTQYYQQAQQLASQGISSSTYPPVAPDLSGGTSTTTAVAQTGATGKWAPLGVFSLAEPGQTQSNMMVQLAINPQGQVRGNYMNQLTNEKSQIYGQLDKKTQRISWTIGENNQTVFDTSLAALTKDDSQVLVHYGPNNTQYMALIRLQQPPNSGNTTASTPPSS